MISSNFLAANLYVSTNVYHRQGWFDTLFCLSQEVVIFWTAAVNVNSIEEHKLGLEMYGASVTMDVLGCLCTEMEMSSQPGFLLQATVAYYLILDNCRSMTKEYLVAEFDEAKVSLPHRGTLLVQL